MTIPLAALIAGRLAQLGLNTHALAARLGYVNTNKGSRRLQTLMEGRLDGHLELLSRLAVALEVSPETVERAVRETEEAKQRRYRAAFVSHAVIVTERTVPSQITFCAVTRGERALWIALDTIQPCGSYARQALRELDRRTEGGWQDIPFFGPAQGFVVNYAWCRAVRFDRQGRAVQFLP